MKYSFNLTEDKSVRSKFPCISPVKNSTSYIKYKIIYYILFIQNKRDVGNAIVNTFSKTDLPILSACNLPSWVFLLL